MKIRIKRFDKEIPMPEYKTFGAAAFDLAARETVTIPSKEIRLVSLNTVVKYPDEYVGILAVRSSAFKLGVMPGNGIGIIDSDYCGEDDELKIQLFNFTDKEVVIEKGVRIAQLMVIKKEKCEIEEVEIMGEKGRGGFGTTGK